MKTVNLFLLRNVSFYSFALLAAFASLLVFQIIQPVDAQASNQTNVILATGKGNGNGGGGNGGGGGGGGETTVGNNLSFPAIATDGFVITPLASSSFTTAYTGPYTGLSADELTALEGSTWYAQKTVGNLWQAQFATSTIGIPVPVYGIDWGDNVEAINPVANTPFRIEVGLYAKPVVPMLGYTMALLANPSSPTEIQGTNQGTYNSEFASVVSNNPKLVIQDITNVCTPNLVWSGSAWTLNGNTLSQDSVSFAPELNVGGKYVYGASEGGWKPTTAGMYRLTMYMPGSDISLAGAVVGNYPDWLLGTTTIVATTTEGDTVGAATPVIDALHNLTYVDVIAVDGSGTKKPGDPGTTTYDPCAVATTTDPIATTTDPVVTPTSSGGGGGLSFNMVSSGFPVPMVAGASTSTVVMNQDEMRTQLRTMQFELLRLLQLLLINRLHDMIALLQA